jgi:hypothetical protein
VTTSDPMDRYRLSYEGFVARYCDGKTPTKLQEEVIRAWIHDPRSQLLWVGGRGGGKSTAQGWLRKACEDLHEVFEWERNNPYIQEGR